MHKLRVGVLRGGTSPEYDVSLKTGQAVLANLPEEKYIPVDMLVTKNGEWHANGRPVTLAETARKVDIVWNALHGEYGEDGKVQQELDSFKIPYTGSGALASAVGMHKHFAGERFRNAGLRIPRGRLLSGKMLALGEYGTASAVSFQIFREIHPPWIVKPVRGGSSVGIIIARSFPELEEAITAASHTVQDILVEEFIRGKEATCGVVDDFRGEELYATLPTEIILPEGSNFFDYSAKYSGESQEICPGRFSREESAMLQHMARIAHKAVGVRHYSRSDFLVTARGIYILEINTLPGLAEQTLLPQSLAAAGAPLSEFLDHILTLAASPSFSPRLREGRGFSPGGFR